MGAGFGAILRGGCARLGVLVGLGVGLGARPEGRNDKVTSFSRFSTVEGGMVGTA